MLGSILAFAVCCLFIAGIASLKLYTDLNSS